MGLEQTWTDVDWVAFDTETSGKYPVESEICEIAAVRWSKGQVTGTFQTLLQVSRPMSQVVIDIHGITNEMLVGAPTMSKMLPEFLKFCDGAYLIGHHSPFDLGFLTLDIEKNGLALPTNPVFCTSLLARAVITDSENHRLQTLIKHLGLPARQAHRALSDAESCLDLALVCFKKLGPVTLTELTRRQGRTLNWTDFSVESLKAEVRYRPLIDALQTGQPVQIEYDGGSHRGQPRTIQPIGLVLSPGQDFIVASSEDGTPPKRFYLNKIKVSRI